jgi:hypothetical protein
MSTRSAVAESILAHGYRVLSDNVHDVAPADALKAAGGYRSILGILKHTAAWTHVYHSYAFEAEPRHWRGQDWPGGLAPDVVDTTPAYYAALKTWLEEGRRRWSASIAGLADRDFDQPHRVHWGATASLWDIVLMVAAHWIYHAGEINALRALERGEAWEYTEEVEENHISTAGHRLRPGWMTDEHVGRHEEHLARRDAELHPEER